MQFPNRSLKIFISLAIYLSAVLLSVCLLVLKREALAFHQRDYNYFIEQAARLTDPRLANSYALQIEGYNFLGLQGIEGVKSLYQAIHAEYFRYLYALLYGIFRNPLALYIFYCLIFYSPILYFALLPYRDEREHLLILLLFSLLYVIFPATINAIGSDLRPRILFAASWSLVILAIFFDRPFWEKCLFFILLVGIREEGIVLGAIAIGLNYLKMKGHPDRRHQTLILMIIDAVALFLFLALMYWGGYTRIDNVYNPLSFIRSIPIPSVLVLLVTGMVVVYLLKHARKKGDQQYRNTLFVLCYALAIVLTAFQWLRDTQRWYAAQSLVSPVSSYDIFRHAVTNETTALVFYILILLGVILWGFAKGNSRKIIIAAYLALIAISTATTLSYYPPRFRQWCENLAPVELVWYFTATHDRYDTRILTDYDTYQAFFNYDQVIVYNRLPVWDALPEKRYYPDNKKALVKQLQKGIDFAVISRDSLENVLDLAELAGIPATEVGANEQYVVIEFEDIP